MNKFTKTIAGIVAVVAFVAVAATSASAGTFTRSLTVGSTGADVTALQTWLNSKGYLAVAPTGYFGNLTKAAVAAFQTANGITPAAGYFGPVSQAKWEMVAGGSTPSTPSTPSTSTTLKGTDGSIDSVSKLSQYNNEEVGEGENGVKVAGFEVQASNDGDIAIRSVKVTFDDAGNTGGSTRLNKYVDSVSLYQGSTKLGTVDVADFTKDSSDSKIWSKTITVKDSVVKSDSKEKFYITVDGVSSYDSADIADASWNVEVTNIRYEDGSGVVTTATDAGGVIADETATDISFVSFATSANTELKFTTDSSTPDAGVVIVDDTDNTKDVVLTKGKVKVEGTSDVLLNELPVTLTVTGATDIDYVTGSVTLTIDGEDYSESVSTSGATSATVTFDNLDITLTAGKTYSFSVKADINDTDSNFEDGDTLKASYTSTNELYVDAENSQGDQLSASEKTGTVTGEAQEFRASGIQLALVSTNTSVTTGTSSFDDQGTFTIKFKVKAVGDTVYVSSLSDAQLSGVTTGKTTIHADKAGTATVTGVSTVITNVSDTTLTSVGNYEIEDGTEETFEITTLITKGSDLYRAVLGGVSWSTTDINLPASAYTSALDTFKTSYIALN